jgi:nucleoid DNA-binding protein
MSITIKYIVREANEEHRLESDQHGLEDISAQAVKRSIRKEFDKIIDHLAEGDKVYLINFLNLERSDHD